MLQDNGFRKNMLQKARYMYILRHFFEQIYIYLAIEHKKKL